MIRRATITDLLDLRRLWDGMVREAPPSYPVIDPEEETAFTQMLAIQLVKPEDQGFFRCWVAEVDGQVVGFLACELQSRAFGKPRIFGGAHWLYVDPAYRHQGISKEMVLAGLDYLDTLGVREVELTALMGDTQWAARGWIPYVVRHVRSTADIRRDVSPVVKEPVDDPTVH